MKMDGIKNIVLGSLILFFVLWKIFYHPLFPDNAQGFLSPLTGNDVSTQLASDPCANRSYCVYLYMAPWCPHCRDMVSQIKDFRNYWNTPDRPGLKVVVGDGDRQAMVAMAQKVGEPVYLDRDKQFLRALHVNLFPDFVVVDSNRRIVASGYGGMRWVENEIDQHLKV